MLTIQVLYVPEKTGVSVTITSMVTDEHLGSQSHILVSIEKVPASPAPEGETVYVKTSPDKDEVMNVGKGAPPVSVSVMVTASVSASENDGRLIEVDDPKLRVVALGAAPENVGAVFMKTTVKL
jgi:hypothetical protein